MEHLNNLKEEEIENIVYSTEAKDNSYKILVTQLQEKEMPGGYKSGGHIFMVKGGKVIKDIKIPCDGLSCSISPDKNFFGLTTMGPEWGVYYFNKEGILIWKKILDKRIGCVEIKENYIVLYDKIHEETRKKIMELNLKGEIVKNN